MRPTSLYLGIAIVLAGAALAWQQQTASVKLAAPYATPSVRNQPHVIPRPGGAQLQVPQGFDVEEWATGFDQPRFMLQGPSNELLLSDSDGGCVYVLTDNGKNRKKILTGLERPYGLALWQDCLYVGERQSLKRYKYDPKAMSASSGQEIVSMKGLDKGHWTRSILFDRQGKKFYLGVGSSSNVSPGDPEMRAAINRFNPDGSGHEIFAAGTRNPIGLHWYPGTDTLWAAVQERDELGDDLVPDYFTHIQQGGFYGWPYAYIGPHEDPRLKGQKPGLVTKTITPDVPLPAHVAVLDFTFYTGNMFPAEYRGGAFLAFHGSWNRSKRAGYEVAFVPFKNGKPSGPLRDFLTGWMISPDSRDVWGRPVAVFQLPDGSLLVSDDGGKKIWRISYKG
jgi:glucose/arabinose dehydrogenase